MADPEYHRKQANILAALALSASDEQEASQFSVLAAQHIAKAEQALDVVPPDAGGDGADDQAQ
jgi:hypothetical protein